MFPVHKIQNVTAVTQTLDGAEARVAHCEIINLPLLTAKGDHIYFKKTQISRRSFGMCKPTSLALRFICLFKISTSFPSSCASTSDYRQETGFVNCLSKSVARN